MPGGGQDHVAEVDRVAGGQVSHLVAFHGQRVGVGRVFGDVGERPGLVHGEGGQQRGGEADQAEAGGDAGVRARRRAVAIKKAGDGPEKVAASAVCSPAGGRRRSGSART